MVAALTKCCLVILPGEILVRRVWMVHFTNILRVVLLSLVSVYNPGRWHFAHDTILRVMFYVVIFAMWVVWVN